MDVHNELGLFACRVAEVADQRVDQHADQVVDVVVLARFEEAGLVEEYQLRSCQQAQTNTQCQQCALVAGAVGARVCRDGAR